MTPGIRKVVPLPYESVLAKLPAALKAEGFGVLTEIDVRQTLHDKLGVDMQPYKILGACNPTLAHRALEAELGVGVMLPCNVVVYGEGDHSVVIAVDPMQTIAASSDALRPIADEVRARLSRVVEAL